MVMRRRLIGVVVSSLLLAGGVLAVGGAPAGADDPPRAPSFAFGVVRLDGNQEVPPADPDGRGTFGFIATPDKLCYVLTARKIEPATLAHIHAAPRGVNGGIVVMLIAPTRGFSADCIHVQPDTTPNTMEVLTQSEVNAIIADPSQFYANVHNDPFPGGAIRGQLR
jgi:hypothetical protein